MALDEQYPFISNPWQWATMIDDEQQVGGGRGLGSCRGVGACGRRLVCCRGCLHLQPLLGSRLLCPLQVLVAERGPLVFVFNFSPFNTYEGLKVVRGLR